VDIKLPFHLNPASLQSDTRPKQNIACYLAKSTKKNPRRWLLSGSDLATMVDGIFFYGELLFPSTSWYDVYEEIYA
jgi:hypothetical protein